LSKEGSTMHWRITGGANGCIAGDLRVKHGGTVIG
jgi:hypothetical protein